MLFLFALLIAWLPAATGWGSILVLVRKRLGIADPYAYDRIEPVIGLVVLTILANLANFFVPVSVTFGWIVWGLGWILFLWRVPHLKSALDGPLWLLAGIVWIGAIATEAVLQAWHYDSGLYHLPAIRWIADSAIPFGLANLHGRLGFNSSWFSVSALLAQAEGPYASNYAALASELLLAVFGLTVIGCARDYFRTRVASVSTVFLILALAAASAPLVIYNLSSPATDHPALLVTLLLIYAALRTAEAPDDSKFKYNLFVMTVLAFFVITIKVSLLPILLLPLYFFWRARRHQVRIPILNFALLLTLPFILIVGLWLARSLILTGCLIYPFSPTCIPNLPWAVPLSQANSEALWIASWGRAPRLNPSQVLTNWNWFAPWLRGITSSIDWLLTAVCLAVALVLLLLNRNRLPPSARDYTFGILAVGVVGIVYWFLSSPDFRFGASWFWSLPLLLLAIGVCAFPNMRLLNLALRFGVIVLFATAAILVANVGVSYVQRAHWGVQNLLYAVPPVPKAEVTVQKTEQGVAINVPGEARCWWTASFCTPYFNAKLYTSRTVGGHLLISLPH